MAAVAVNNFRTITTVVGTGAPVEIYTAPTGYTSVFLLLQVTNTDSATRTVTFNHVRTSTTTELVKEFPIPAGDSLDLLAGKLVLQTGDKVSITGSSAGVLKFCASVLETSNF
tara:strand:+ start:1618 stop:1956 length:339 start_codon:yes stop_codon:yes gene_type:complete